MGGVRISILGVLLVTIASVDMGLVFHLVVLSMAALVAHGKPHEPTGTYCNTWCEYPSGSGKFKCCDDVPVTPPPCGGGNCIDKIKHCQTWAHSGLCKKVPDYMLPNCPKACGQCGGGGNCIDKVKHCQTWAHSGLCKKVPDYMLPNCPKACGQCVACQESGGQIQQRKCCPWYSNDPDHCVTYDDCVCKDGFFGDECEHDCSSTSCPSDYTPVCAGTDVSLQEITFSNKCLFLTALCNKDYQGYNWLHFMYNGECQNHTICHGYNCPTDVSVYFYDDPKRPGCKLCDYDHTSPC